MKTIYELIRVDDSDIEYSFGLFVEAELADEALEELSKIYDEHELMIVEKNLVESSDEIQDELEARANEYELEMVDDDQLEEEEELGSGFHDTDSDEEDEQDKNQEET